jgi:SAM-dependent methyltransferase
MDEARRLSFGSVAEQYDRTRPSYPDALIDDVLAYGSGRRALEVGAGTGKATVLFAQHGASVVALEPDAGMAAIARRNCAQYPSVTVELIDFERWHLPADPSFDVLVSAQAWHWVTPGVRTSRAGDVLVDGGAIALFWNWPRWDACPLADSLTDAYGSAGIEFRHGPGPMYPRQTGLLDRWGAFDAELAAAPEFGAHALREYEWTSDYTRDEYLSLLQTHSDHIVLDEGRRRALFTAIGAVIDRAGGRLTITYVTYLRLARRVTTR